MARMQWVLFPSHDKGLFPSHDNIKTTTETNAKIDAISFSANYLKEVLLSNKEIKDGVLKVSSKGIAVAEFAGEGFTSKYYLVQIDTKD